MVAEVGSSKKFDIKRLEDNPMFIAEVGQNHQGDLDLALKYVREFAARGATAIKFQARSNKYLFDISAYNKSYDSENSFGDTYGQHREALELSAESLKALKLECQSNEVDFMVTPFDEPSLELLCDIGVDCLKIASFDLGNLPFVDLIAQTKIPVVLSVGGGRNDQIRGTVAQILKHHSDIAVLHCVSEYPCPLERLGLSALKKLRREFPNLAVGVSDHFHGISSGPVSYLLGARVFEKHVTFNRAWRGSDHSFALEPHGWRNFVRDVLRVPQMMQVKPVEDLGKEAVFQKLGKSIVVNKNLSAGEVLSMDVLSSKIFNQQYIPVRQSSQVIGNCLKVSKEAGSYLSYDDVLFKGDNL